MAKTKLSEHVYGVGANNNKKKRRSDASNRGGRESDDEKPVKKGKKTPSKADAKPQKSATPASASRSAKGVKAASAAAEKSSAKASSASAVPAEAKPANNPPQQQQLGGDNLALLKERFNTLHEVRFTEPEKQCTELLQLVEDQKHAHEQLVKKLEQRIITLEQSTRELSELKKREKHLLEDNAAVKAEIESIRKSLELADQERSALVKALETVEESPKDAAAIDQMIALLDTFKVLTGITVKLDDDDLSQGSCTIYNQRIKKGVRLSVSMDGAKVTLTPAVNKNLLPPELRNHAAVLPKEDVPAYVAQITSALFL